MFQCMVGVWLVRQGSNVFWKMLGLGAGGSVVLEGWLSVLCGCGFAGCLSILCGCGGHVLFESLWHALCGRGGHALFESLLHALCGCGGISFRNSVDR